MQNATLRLSKYYKIGDTDDRLFGSFVEHMGSTVYNGIFQPGHPSSDTDGTRTDVLELVKELELSMIRYPGGNFVSGFAWEDSVGPIEDRPVRLDLAWKAIEPNTFGLNEFMHWIRKIPAEPIMSVNLGTRGIDAARNLVEYCNFPGGSHYSMLRQTHGVQEPYGIKTWCLGNEMDGAWQVAAKTAEQYGLLSREAGKAMKWVDPDIELIAVGSSTPRMSEFPAWDKTVLMHTYEVVDYISLHHYIDRQMPYNPISNQSLSDHLCKGEPVFIDTATYLARSQYVEQQIRDIIAVCDYVKSVKRSRKTMYLSFDEWNVIAPKKHIENNDESWSTGEPIDCGAHSMEDLLVFACMMMAIVRRADRVKIACQSLLVNTGPLVVCSRDGKAWRNSIFYPFLHISKYGRGEVLNSILDCPLYDSKELTDTPVLDNLCVYNRKKGELSLFLVNRSDSPVDMEIDVRDYSSVSFIEHQAMFHSELDAVNTEKDPDNIVPVLMDEPCRLNEKEVCRLEAFSWNMIRYRVT